MADARRDYESDTLRVHWDATRCIHVGACVRGLPGVFDPQRRPWIELEGADPAAVMAVVQQCPTGALHAERTDADAPEIAPAENSVQVTRSGPVFLRGTLRVMGPYNAVLVEDTRLALCRCGASRQKPFCDGSHARAGFSDPAVAPPAGEPVPVAEPGELRIEAMPRGPLVLRGPMVLLDAAGRRVATMPRCTLCRCGASQQKPFCDGSHATSGFDTPAWPTPP